MATDTNKRAVKAPRRDVFLLDPNDITVIGVDTDHASKSDHYLWDPRTRLPIDEYLVRNIQTYGVIKPIVVVKDGDAVLVVDGRQRVLHARQALARQKKAGEEEVRVPVMFRRGEERYLFGVSRAANLARQDSVLTNAMNAQRMIDMGASPAETACAFGVKVSTLTVTWLPLLDLSGKVRQAVEKGEMSAQAASALCGLGKAEQEAHLEELRAAGVKPTHAAVTTKVRGTARPNRAPTPSEKLTTAMAQVEALYARTLSGHEVKAGDLLALARTLSGRDLEAELAQLAPAETEVER